MKHSDYLLRALALVAVLSVASCSGDDDGGGGGDIASDIGDVKAKPTDKSAQQNLLKALAGATAADLKTDGNKNGKADGLDVIELAKLRIVQAPDEQPDSSQKESGKTYTQVLLDRVIALNASEEQVNEARFTQAMYTVGQALEPIGSITSLVGGMGGSDSGASGGSDALAGLDLSAVLPLLTSLLDPTTKCADGGLAKCGKDISDAIKGMGTAVSGTYTLPAEVTLTVSNNQVALGGTYNEASLRALAAVGEVLNSLLYYLAAHIDLASIVSQASSLLSGLDLSFDTAGQVFSTVDALDGVLIEVFEGAMKKAAGKDQLSTARSSTGEALKWLNGDGGSKPAVVSAIEKSTAEGLVVRLVDANSNGALDGCDSIQINLQFLSDVLSTLYTTTPETGCGAVPANSFQLPKQTDEGKTVEYSKLFSESATSLVRFRDAVLDSSKSVSIGDVSGVLTAAGQEAIPNVAAFYPGLAFDVGLSFLTPASSGTGSALTFTMEAEINENANACPDGKTAKGDYICKDKKGTKDWSAKITRGDGAHFSSAIAADNISISEAILDAQGAKADNFFRASLGGGILPYLKFKSEDLKGIAKIDTNLLKEATDSTLGVCARKIAQSASGAAFVALDTRTTNALINFALVQGVGCGENSQIGKLFAGVSMPSLSDKRGE